jgi:hypothetical protein
MHSRQARQAAQVLPLRLLPLPIALPRMIEMLQWPAHHANEPGSLWLRGILQDTAHCLSRFQEKHFHHEEHEGHEER